MHDSSKNANRLTGRVPGTQGPPRRVWGLLPLIFALWLLMAVCPLSITAQSDTALDGTMLMFVGEDLEVLSIASRREESAMQAPAIAHVITRDELRESGTATLGDALSSVPGFFMAQKEWGALPYLRGISNSILFLYDTVPLNSDTTKSLHQLDNELSLAPVKRIEILQGPGSMLWGSDAFAGIVNVVPLTGGDVDGVETEAFYRDFGDMKGFSLTAGGDTGTVDAILSITGSEGREDEGDINLVRYWGEGETLYPPEERMGTGNPGTARQLDIYGRIEFHELFSLSGRVSDNRTPYSITRAEGDLTWEEARSFPGGFFKFESKKNLGISSALRMTAYYSRYTPELEIVDQSLTQKEETAYGELIYDRSFFSRGALLTGGLSWRGKSVEDANVFVSYLPDYLGEDNISYFPIIFQEDYDTRLFSAFGQYAQKIGKFDVSMGLRYDGHDSYEDNVSYNAAAVWNLSPGWILKLLYGTAYRTPYARQLLSDDLPELEKIQDLSFQISWRPSDRGEAAVTLFTSRIENHFLEDPYAGLSDPNRQDIRGLEIEGRYRPIPSVDLSGNLTLLDNSGPDETYRYVSFVYIRPDGTLEENWERIEYPFDTGAKRTANLSAGWQPLENVSARIGCRYVSERFLLYPRGGDAVRFPEQWTTDLSFRVKNLTRYGLELAGTVENLFDRSYLTPGVYSAIEGDPREVRITFRKSW